jgi:trk system potassium uptake protein
MKILIIGGGKLSYYLVKTLQPGHHELTLIEKRMEICERIATDFNVEVYNGDGTNIALLEQAGAADMDILIALTGKDESNLIASEICKKKFGIRFTVAKVNNPKNIEMFERLGVDKPVSSTQIVADLIEQEVEYSGMKIVMKVQHTTKVIVEFPLSAKSQAAGKKIRDFEFASESKVILHTTPDGKVEIPNGDTSLIAGETLMMVCDKSQLDQVWKAMVK